MQPNFQTNIFTVVKFQPQNILLLHKKTNKIYRYIQISSEDKNNPQVQCGQSINLEQSRNVNDQLILKSQPLCGGYIYQKQVTSIGKIVRQRSGKYIKNHFAQVQINNTFDEILNNVKKGVEYGNIRIQNILIDNNGNIKLKDPVICTYEKYKWKQTKLNDYQSIGLSMLKCALLVDDQSFQKFVGQICLRKLVESLMDIYSVFFISNIWILINCIQQLIQFVDLQFTTQSQCKMVKQVFNSKQLNKKPNIEKYRKIIQQVQKIRNGQKQDHTIGPSQKQQSVIINKTIQNQNQKLKQKQNQIGGSCKLDKQVRQQKQRGRIELNLKKDKKIIIIPALNLNIKKGKKQQIIKSNFFNKNPKIANQNNGQFVNMRVDQFLSPQAHQGGGNNSKYKQKKANVKVEQRINSNLIQIKNINRIQKLSLKQDSKSLFKRKGKTLDRNFNIK